VYVHCAGANADVALPHPGQLFQSLSSFLPQFGQKFQRVAVVWTKPPVTPVMVA
jgi:hypothetical protein